TASPPTCGRETSARPSTPRTRSSPAGYRSTRGSANSQVRRTAASSRAGWAASTRSKECSTVIRSGRALPSICNGEAREAGSAVASPSLGHTPAPYVGHILSASDTTAAWTRHKYCDGNVHRRRSMFRGIVFVGLLAMAPSLAMAQQPCTTDARHVVDELYRHMLERTADAGSQGWVDRLNSGTTVREIVRQIAQSPEHMQRFFNGNDQDSVGTMYRHILGRQPDASGLRTMTDVANRQGRP